MKDLDWIVSADDHVVEPPQVWTDRLPAKFLDRAPRFIRDGEQEYWLFDGKATPIRGLEVTAGKRREDYSPEPVTRGEMRTGCYDPKARIEDMDRGGILASITFPTFPQFRGTGLQRRCRP